MDTRIETLTEKKLLTKSLRMSLTDNKTFDLWHSFMSEKSSLKNTVGTDLYSIQLYDDPLYHKNFDPNTEFTKLAGIEVANPINIPTGFSLFTLPGGLYAVFLHKGGTSGFRRTFQYIFGQWLPGSGYVLDNRPHFELLGDRYKNNAPDSEEEVWIPIKAVHNDR